MRIQQAIIHFSLLLLLHAVGIGTVNANELLFSDCNSCCDLTEEMLCVQNSCNSSAIECGDSNRLWERIHRNMEQDGITFEGDVIQFYQGVVHGGRTERFRYSGHADYQLSFDLETMAGMEGWSVELRGEHRWGQLSAQDAGAILPPALYSATPVPDSEKLILSNLIFTKVVDEHLTVFFGKLDTLDGDQNPFASGRGKDQFMNTSLILPVHALPTVPLSTLGAGAVYSVDGLPLAQLIVMNAEDTVSTSGFDELFEEGVLILGGINLPTSINGKLGIHTFSGAWNSRNFTDLNQDGRLIIPNTPIEETSGSWVFWWSGAQYLYQNPCDPTKGWGLFGRAGFSDANVNPVKYFFNAGIGGNSPISGRENDLFGIGWFYNRISNELGPVANAALAIGSSTTGVEMYYNYAVTSQVRITGDLQVLEPASQTANTALLCGLRLEIDF